MALTTHDATAVEREVDRLLSSVPAYNRMQGPARREMRDAMTRVSSFLAGQSPETHARPLADPRSLRPGSTTTPGTSQPPSTPSAPAAGGTAPTGSGSTTARVGEVARATLNAIDFPSFVASLIQGTFQAIVDASIQQMEAYAELLKNTALTVDAFMTDNVTDGMARDYLADRYEGVFQRDTGASAPKLRLAPTPSGTPLPSFFGDLGLQAPEDLNDNIVEETVVPATRRMLAEQRQQTLATMVLMGINRVVVSDGEIAAKLQFHIDASETSQMRFDQTKQNGMAMSGTAGRNPFTASGVMVNTTSLNAQSDINVRADLVGNVVVRFRSETFPLERFADSAAIQLINTRAKVPAPEPAPAAPTAPTAPTLPPIPSPSAATPAPVAPPVPGTAPAQQSSFDVDPWGSS